jgi:hypothetical protein|tara:strand:+ start:27 stop:380 length:354 start_codon:yes stop_codon:yes gene_type:complete
LTVGKNVAQRAVIRRKHLLREPHLMPVSHTNLSLNQAHCLQENAPQVFELPVFSLFLTLRGYRLECCVTGLIFGLASLVEQRLAENQQPPGSAVPLKETKTRLCSRSPNEVAGRVPP